MNSRQTRGRGKTSDEFPFAPVAKQLTIPRVHNFGAAELGGLNPGRSNALPPSKIHTRPSLSPKRGSVPGNGMASPPSPEATKSVSKRVGHKLKPLSGDLSQGFDFRDLGHQSATPAQPTVQRARRGKEAVFVQGTKGGPSRVPIPGRFPPSEGRKPSPLTMTSSSPGTKSPSSSASRHPERTPTLIKLESIKDKPNNQAQTNKKDEKKVLSTKQVVPSIINPYERILVGDMENLPPQRSSVVRIFLSSTFSDFKAERNALARQAYPELKGYCAGLGLDFQVVDLRWGISEGSSNDHTVEQICLGEIELCQRLSRGPNFVAMTGNRYGSRPIPPAIDAVEFALLRRMADDLSLDDRELLDAWYLKNNNSIPPVHLLQPINSKLPHFNDYSEENLDKRKEDSRKWKSISTTLQKLLRQSVSSAIEKGQLPVERKQLYFQSVTEQEIEKGILWADDPDKTAFYIKRNLETSTNVSAQALADKFFDMTLNPETSEMTIDQDAAEFIKDLSNVKIKKKLGLSNVHRLTTEWKEGGIDPQSHPEHQEYLNKFCATFTETTKRLLDEYRENEEKEMMKEASTVINLTANFGERDAKAEVPTKGGKTRPFQSDGATDNDIFAGYMSMQNLLQEHKAIEATSSKVHIMDQSRLRLSEDILHHLHFCKSKCEVFCGRDDELGDFRLKLKRSGKGKPLVLYGKSGLGKTAYLAAIAQQAKNWLKGCVTIVRFLGTSPQSTDIRKVLGSLCKQICLAYGQTVNKSKFTKVNKAAKYLNDLLSYIAIRYGSSRPLVIVLDSLDQLSPEGGAYKCKWLPDELPTYVHLIVSTLPDKFNILSNARDRLNNDESCFIELKPYAANLAELYAKAYTSNKNVQLTETQFSLLLASLSANPEPLPMKLMLDEACTWKSYTDTSGIRLAKTTQEAINSLFDRLERKYGAVFVRACLAYLTLGLNGLSEIELEDVLSCDDPVLQDVYKYHSPPIEGVVRIPSLMWARVRHDLREYIVERHTHGKVTMNWYHRQFTEAAQRKYASGEEFRKRHRLLAEIYLVEERYTRLIHLPHRKLTIEDADRQVTPQPKVLSNIRRMTSLPYHLKHAGDTQALKEHVFCNMDFLQKFTEVFSVNQIIQRMDDVTDEEVESVKNCLRYSSVQLDGDPSSMATQLLGQLIDKAKDKPMLRELCHQAEVVLLNSHDASLVPITGGMAPSTSLLKWYLNGVTEISAQTDDGSYLLLRSENEKKISSFSILNTEKLKTRAISSKSRLAPKTVSSPKTDRGSTCSAPSSSTSAVQPRRGRVVHTQNTDTNHKDELNSCIATSSDDRYIALAGKDRLALLEDLTEEGAPYRARGAMNLSGVVGTTNLIFSSDDNHTISTHKIKGQKKTIGCIVLWDCWGKRLQTKIALPVPVEPGFLYPLSPLAGHDLVVCGCENAQIFIVDMHLGKVVTDIFKELNIKSPILSSYSKQNSILVTCIKGQQEVKVWDVDIGNVSDVATFNARAPVTTVSMSSDGQVIVTADEIGTIKLFDIPSKSQKNSIKCHNGTLARILCTDRDQVFTCASDRVLKYWDLEELLTHTEEEPVDQRKSGGALRLEDIDVLHLAFSPDGKHVAIGCTRGVTLWTLSGEDLAMVKQLGTGSFSSMAFSADSSSLACLDLDTRALVCWKVPSGEAQTVANLVSGDKFNSLCFLNGGKRLALVQEGDPNRLVIIDFVERESVTSVAIDNLIGDVTLCTSLAGLEEEHIVGLVNLQTTSLGVPHYSAVAISVQTGKMLTCQFEDRIAKQKASKNLQVFSVSNAGEDGGHCRGVLLGCYGDVYLWQPPAVYPIELKDAKTGHWPEKSLHHYWKKLDISVDEVLTLPVTMVTASTDRNSIATGNKQGSIVLWTKSADDSAKFASTLYLKGHSNVVSSASFSSQSDYLVTGSHDRTLRVWDARVGTLLCKAYVHMSVDTVHFLPGDKFIAVQTSDMERKRAIFFKLTIH